ncbi:MAG: hypothetical protein ACXV76_07955 [Halobacteriota archaeon]
MHFVTKTRIEQKRSKPTIAYPLIRLPKIFAKVIGTPVTVYQTQCKGRTAFVVILDDQEGDLSEGGVGQLGSEVGQPRHKKDLQSRLSALESEIKDIKLLLSQKNSEPATKNKKQAPESGFEPESEPRQLSWGAKLPPARSARS